MRKVLPALAALALGLSAPAWADIRTFNAAVQAGDYRGATSEAKATWPTIDRAAPDAAVVAREFGWVAMLAGEPAAALEYTRFLVDEGPRLTHPDQSPAVSRVLHDWASLEAASSAASRAKLLASLQARAMVAGRDLISARAAQALQAEAWGLSDWETAERAAALAVRFIGELGETTSPAMFEARRNQAVANFIRTKSPQAYDAIYDVAAEVHDSMMFATAGPARERLGREYFAATAWGDAAYGALVASRRPPPDRRLSINAGRTTPAELLYPAPGEAGLPRCKIALARGAKTPGFPFVSKFKDFGGSVTFALELAANGTFTNPKLLAAAPHADFVKATEDVMDTWRWKLDGSLKPPFCRMPQVHILTFEFVLGR